MRIKDYLWLFPFLSFIGGYVVIQRFYSTDTVRVPSLLGKPMHDAVRLLSATQLNLHLLAEKDDPDVPTGTVIQQKPESGTRVRTQQTVFLVVSKQPPHAVAPSVVNRPWAEVQRELEKSGIRAKMYLVDAECPTGLCCAQLPASGEPLDRAHTMLIYVASGTPKPVLMPDIRNNLVTDVQSFLATHGLTPQLFHAHPISPEHICRECLVTDQRPLPGSIVTLNPNQPLLVQLQVE